MARRPKTAVHFFTEGDGFVVRGTLDPHEALALAVAELDQNDQYFDLLWGVTPPATMSRMPDHYVIDPEAVAVLAGRCHEWLADARPGLYRMNIASHADREDYGVSWWLGRCSKPGPGVWSGVYFS